VIWIRRFAIVAVATVLIAGCGGQTGKDDSTAKGF